MSASGNTWEGYQWVDGWPVSPPRPHQQQQPPQREPTSNDEGEMAVEMEPAAGAVTNNISVTVNSGTVVSRQIEESNQVNDFDPSLAGSTYTSEDETDEDIPGEKQVELGSGYTQCRAAR
jgi:hypothetical protein